MKILRSNDKKSKKCRVKFFNDINNCDLTGKDESGHLYLGESKKNKIEYLFKLQKFETVSISEYKNFAATKRDDRARQEFRGVRLST